MGKPKPKLHECPDCPRSFSAPEALQQHRVDRHGAAHMFTCGQCNKRCKDAPTLQRHINGAHSGTQLPIGRRPTLAEVDPICIECGEHGHLVDGRRIYPHRSDLYAKSFYLCACGAYCGCHPGSVVPLGNPCGPVTRRARSAAHDEFDPLWKRGTMSRASAYAWLAEATGIAPQHCHIGMMTAEQANLVATVVRQRGQAEAA